MNQNQFGNKKELHKTIYNIYIENLNNKIDLDAQYQRGRVWINKDKEAFIDSILNDILPSPIVMNNDNSIGKYICIDGKQRITTIVDFIDNKFPIKQEGIMVYYSMIPKNQQINKNAECRIFDQREKNVFDSRCIHIVMYDDLSIKNQVDVFYRVNHGEKLSEDEIMNYIVSYNQKIEDIVHDKQILKLLNKHNGKNDNENLLLRIIFMLTNKNKEPFKIPRKIGALNDFYNDIDKDLIHETGEQILKILTGDAYGLLKYNNNNILLAGAYFIKHNDYFDESDLMKKLSDELSLEFPDNVSSDNLNTVYLEFIKLDKKQKDKKMLKVKKSAPKKIKKVRKIINDDSEECETVI